MLKKIIILLMVAMFISVFTCYGQTKRGVIHPPGRPDLPAIDIAEEDFAKVFDVKEMFKNTGLRYTMIPMETIWAAEASFPTKLDYRDINGIKYSREMNWWENQICGSCLIWAGTSVMESAIKLQMKTPNDAENLLNISEQYWMSCSTQDIQCDGGVWSQYDDILDLGMVEEKYSPYLVANDNPYRKPPIFFCWEAMTYDIKTLPRYKAKRVMSASCMGKPERNGYCTKEDAIAIMKYQLNTYGPYATAVMIRGDFNEYWFCCPEQVPIFKHDHEKFPGFLGAHAVVIVGYNDEERYAIVKNAGWGWSWGYESWGKISYDDMGEWFQDPETGEMVENYIKLGVSNYSFDGIYLVQDEVNMAPIYQLLMSE
jgi:hypothetical protein